jgi:hypothetical protein
MANERASNGVQEEEVVEEAAEVALSSLPARHIDALDVKVAPLGFWDGRRYLQKFQCTLCCEIGS